MTQFTDLRNGIAQYAGQPAITPRINEMDLYAPTFTAEDAQRFVESTHEDWQIISVQFATHTELDAEGIKLGGNSPNRLICIVEARGEVTVSVPPSVSRSLPSGFHLGGIRVFFDARTGNQLCMQVFRV
jgi:hypothetical protein